MVRDLIQALGGPAVVSEWATKHGPGVLRADTVYVWISAGRGVPWRWRATIHAMAKEKGLVLTEDQLDALALMAPVERDRAASDGIR